MVNTLGGRKETPNICSEAQALINQAIITNHPSVKRLVVVTSRGTGESYNDMSLLEKLFANTVISKALADKLIQEKLVVDQFPVGSATDWIIVRPGGLRNGDITNNYAVGEKMPAKTMVNMVSRADVAHFIINEALEGPKHSRHAVTIIDKK